MKNKLSLAELLVKRGLAKDLKSATGLILAGQIYDNKGKLDKPGIKIKEDAIINLKTKQHEWVSRGGMKLDHALRYFQIDVKDKIAIDIGASTGGFTDVLLYNGAKRIYAIDVGYGELAWKIRSNEKVVVKDRTNAKFLNSDIIPEKLEFICSDASFISLKQVLPPAMNLATDDAILVALIKPQFEAKKSEVGAGGIITDNDIHKKICDDIHEWLDYQEGWKVAGITESPILGMEGNKEFLIMAQRNI